MVIKKIKGIKNYNLFFNVIQNIQIGIGVKGQEIRSKGQ